MKSVITDQNPRWSELSEFQRDDVSNGCGAKGCWLRPPSFMFTASCDQHDFYYWRGASEADRVEADEAFLRAMLKDASRSGWWIRWLHRSLAYTYYWAVREYGDSYFTYRQSPATWGQLEDYIAEQQRLFEHLAQKE